MRHISTLAVGTAVLALAAAAFASPLKVRTEGTKSQTIVMCEDCQARFTCARVGDYRIGLSVDLDNAKFGTGRIIAHVQEADGRPVVDAAVRVTLTMPDHRHGSPVIPLKYEGYDRYAATTNRLSMSGRYLAEVSVRLPGGDTVKQLFSFTR